MHTDICGNTDRNVKQKKAGKNTEIQEFIYSDMTNVEPEM